MSAGLTFAVVVVAGFTACAEFGSFAFVHPVIRRLPRREHILVEQGLVRTFGRVMPVLMTASLGVLIAWASLTALALPSTQRSMTRSDRRHAVRPITVEARGGIARAVAVPDHRLDALAANPSSGVGGRI